MPKTKVKLEEYPIIRGGLKVIMPIGIIEHRKSLSGLRGSRCKILSRIAYKNHGIIRPEPLFHPLVSNMKRTSEARDSLSIRCRHRRSSLICGREARNGFQSSPLKDSAFIMHSLLFLRIAAFRQLKRKNDGDTLIGFTF